MEDDEFSDGFSDGTYTSSSSSSFSESSTTDDSDDELMPHSDHSGALNPSPPSSPEWNVGPNVSISSDSNPPSPTVSSSTFNVNTESGIGEDSNATVVLRRSQSSDSILSATAEENMSPQPVDILPRNSSGDEPEEVPSADVAQVINEVAAVQQEPEPPQASEPDVGNGESISKPEPSQGTAADVNSSCVSETDDNSLCSICMDPLTNSGKHRVVCLRCGHIFGQSCLERWIKVGCNNGAKRCPSCNKKACLKDIRILYLPKVVPLDTVEKDRLIKEKEELIVQKNLLELELSKCKLQRQLSVRKFEEKIAQLEKELCEAKNMLNNFTHVPSKEDIKENKYLTAAKLEFSVELCKEGGCRVLAYSPILQELVVSQPSGNTLFAGFGVRVLNSVDFQPSRYMFLHSKMIRDLAFHPEDRDMLLSVSLDQTAKLVDLASSTTVHTFKGEGPLWSCCWDASNPHLMLVGSQLGKVCQYDRRMTDTHVNIWSTTQNLTPVVSLASVPSVAQTPFPQGGFLSCRLNGAFAYARHGNLYNCQELQLNGPFMSMRYDSANQNLITSARPSSSCPYVRISLNLVDVDDRGNVCLPEIHTFNCGSSARFLSRVTTVPTRNDSIVVAHHESGRTLNMWSSKTGSLLQSIPTREPIIDLANMCVSGSKCLFASLSEKRVCIYKVS